MTTDAMADLPIDQQLPKLLATLTQHRRCLLQAPPGAGKTTRVPLALLAQPWLLGQKILLLEPRRIAARSAARFMAAQLNETVGQQVGYRLRLDSRIGPDTRIEVVTEGILTRMLQDDPGLEGVGCLIFDEFHERSLQADLGLALALESQQLFRDDLRILIMSATLDSEALSRHLGPDLPVISSQGRSFDVVTHYLATGELKRFQLDSVVQALVTAAWQDAGSILCFLPGSGEIKRTLEALQQQSLPAALELVPLYGGLKPEQQDQAIAAPEPGRRKLVLATDIAETSLTIDGVNVVVDTGLSRKPRFDPRSGMSALTTRAISRASAEQRRGRAGRQQAGVCYRLWSEHQQQGLQPHSPAEILHADLAALALELAQWGAQAEELCWLDAPPRAHLDQAVELLQQLGALDAKARITAMGRAMVKLGCHPRLAHMMLKARELGLGPLGCDLAALLGEKDLLGGTAAAGPGHRSTRPADIRLRLEQLNRAGKQLAQGLLRRIRATSSRWQRQLRIKPSAIDTDAAGLLLCFAFPDRIAQRRDANSRHYRLRNGRGALFIDQDALCQQPYLVIADLDGQQRNARIFLAAPVTEALLRRHFADQIEQLDEVSWNANSESVRARQRTCLGALVLQESAIARPSTQLLSAGLLAAIRQQGLDCLPWSPATRNLWARLQLMGQHLNPSASATPPWPDFSERWLLDNLQSWLGPHLDGWHKLEQLQQLDLRQLLLNRLDWSQQQQLEEQLPSHYQVPSGSRIAIDYLSRDEPLLAVRIQELFGLQRTPALLGGQLPLTIQLLSPARRPIQITRDLSSFWQRTYADVCKDLKGRYPKHYWPEDPSQAVATRGTKKSMGRNAK